ncbi:MAG: 50S ribosomal protein L32 [Candidatus Colwellbacteria bacterium]|nr:50S ribosomal protein L32 [Candidatus Colwellbacteria bacterium]
MGVPKKHHTKSKVGRRRSQQARRPLKLIPCVKCAAPNLPHRVCKNCGHYGGKTAR